MRHMKSWREKEVTEEIRILSITDVFTPNDLHSLQEGKKKVT